MFQQYDGVLCLNGAIPDVDFWERLPAELPIFACDGAVLALEALGLKPTLVLGDADSIGGAPYQAVFVHLACQEHTDFAKTLRYLNDRGTSRLLIVGIHGGDIDHTLQNIHTFMAFSLNMSLHFYDHLGNVPKWGFSLPLGVTELLLTSEQTISIFPHPEAVISSEGLVWDLHEQQLDIAHQTSARNRARALTIRLQLHHGRGLVTLEEQPRMS